MDHCPHELPQLAFQIMEGVPLLDVSGEQVNRLLRGDGLQLAALNANSAAYLKLFQMLVLHNSVGCAKPLNLSVELLYAPHKGSRETDYRITRSRVRKTHCAATDVMTEEIPVRWH
jgi:hypothetical protein